MHRNPRYEVLVYFPAQPESRMMKQIIREASVHWIGGVDGGTKTVTTGSGVLTQTNFSSAIPVRRDSVTDPAELIGAAHASSFSLALANELGVGVSAGSEIDITATVTMEHLSAGWTITKIHLDVIARLSKMTQGDFIDAAVRAKTSCLVSRLLRANISMTAKLDNEPFATADRAA